MLHCKITLAALLLFVVPIAAFCQEKANWDVYLASYEDGPGSTVLNMNLISEAPKATLPFVVITGVTYTACDEDGFPVKSEFDNLYAISDKINALLASVTKMEHVGSFTQRCERLEYIYVRDTSNIRAKLVELYKSKFKSYKYYINIEDDKDWQAYREFLYPNEETLEYMSNEKVLDQLRAAGDKLEKARKVDHWLYFKSDADRGKFVKYAEGQKFRIESKDYVKESDPSYQLHISRIDMIDSGSINKLTLELKKRAKEFGGEYDGWETEVVTK